jgi:hypothetical protein
MAAMAMEAVVDEQRAYWRLIEGVADSDFVFIGAGVTRVFTSRHLCHCFLHEFVAFSGDSCQEVKKLFERLQFRCLHNGCI